MSRVLRTSFSALSFSHKKRRRREKKKTFLLFSHCSFSIFTQLTGLKKADRRNFKWLRLQAQLVYSYYSKMVRWPSDDLNFKFNLNNDSCISYNVECLNKHQYFKIIIWFYSVLPITPALHICLTHRWSWVQSPKKTPHT